MSKKNFTLLLSFLRGVAWAIAIYGATLGFLSYFGSSILTSIILTFFGALPGLFFVVVFEYLNIRLYYLDKDSIEIEKIRKLLDDKISNNRS